MNVFIFVQGTVDKRSIMFHREDRLHFFNRTSYIADSIRWSLMSFNIILLKKRGQDDVSIQRSNSFHYSAEE